jgi:hypothetical protein
MRPRNGARSSGRRTSISTDAQGGASLYFRVSRVSRDPPASGARRKLLKIQIELEPPRHAAVNTSLSPAEPLRPPPRLTDNSVRGTNRGRCASTRRIQG